MGAVLALSAGVLVGVGASHLLPEVEKHGGWHDVLTVAAGFLVGVVIIAARG